MTEVVEKKLSAAEERLKANVEIVRPFVSYNEAAKAHVVDPAFFAATLPEGMTEAIVKKAFTAVSDAAAALAQVTGESAVKLLKKHKGLDAVHTEVSVPIGNFAMTTHRNFDVRNVSTGEVTQRHGHTVVKVRASNLKSGAGPIRLAVSHVQALGASELAG